LEGIYYKAQIEAEKYNFKEALNIIETNIKGKDRDFAYYRFHGMYMYYTNEKKYATRALEDFKKSYELKPDSFITNSLIGRCYLTMGDYPEALNFFENANELYEDDMNAPPIYYELAQAYLNCGRVEEALRVNALAIQKDTNYSWYYMQRGIILSQDGDKASLDNNYAIAIETDPNDINCHREYINRLIEMLYIDEAYNLCVTLLENNNDYGWIYADEGYILMLKGELDKSKELLDKAEHINNTDEDTLIFLSFYYYVTNNFEKAYEYDAMSKLLHTDSDIVYWAKNQNDYAFHYKDNIYFKLLLNKFHD
jgi:tetratricopeptide (TPR) repeat protein